MRTIKELIYVLKMYGLPRHGEEKSIMQEAAEALEMLQQELQDERYRHDRYVDFELAQAEELRKLKEQARWIPVTERLPEKMCQCVCRYVFGDDEEYPFYQVLLFFALDKSPHFQHNGTMGMRVTHWMPLPEPPKEV